MSNVSRTPLTFEEHQKIGQQLTSLDKDLVFLDAKLQNGYPGQKKFSKLIKQLDTSLTKLRSLLDITIYDEFPEKSHTDRISVYFGPEKSNKTES
jgi:hypothetical protein